MPAKKKAKSKNKKSTIPSNVKNKALYARVKAEAKRKFDVYPSAYANAWLVKTYKKRGGTYA
jgi:DNA topoisomerase IA